MDFDFTTETITPDSTTILTIGSTGALELPSGTTGQQPVGAIAGGIRWNTTLPQLEYYNGTVWLSFSGSVTSVQASGGTTGLTFTGGPITSSGTLTLSGTLGPANGGTGATAVPTNGQILVGNGTTFTVATVATGTGISTTVGAGTLQINNTGVTSAVAGTGISVSGATGAVTISNTGVTSLSFGTTGLTPATTTTGAITVAGTLVVSNGGTGATTLASNGVLLGNGTSPISATAVGATGTVLAGNTGAAPTFTNTPAISGANFTAASIPNSALANSSVTIGTTTISLGSTQTALTGLTGVTLVSGTVTGVANPVAATDVVNLSYLQSVIAGLEWKQTAVAATTVNLSATYANGASGVGATLTATANGAISLDGYSPVLNDRVLVKNQTTQTQNGIYTVTTVGTAGTPFVLTRAIDANTTSGLNNATLFITNGTTQTDTSWTQTTANPTIGTSSVVFVQNSGSGTYNAGTGLTLTGNTFSLTSPVSPSLGGTGTTTAPSAGQVLIGTSGGVYTPAALTQGTGITITSASGSVTVANAGVLTWSGGTTGLTPNTATSGAVTLGGTLVVSNGGTGATTLTQNGVLFGNGTSAVGITAVGTTGQVLVATTGSAPTFGAVNLASSSAVTGILPLANGGTNANITAAAGAVAYSTASTLALSAVGTAGFYLTSGGAGAPTWSNPATSLVTSISFGTTGLTPSTATTGAVTVAGTLAVANGGTGLTAAPTNGQIDIGSTGVGFVRTTITAGTAISVVNGAGTITINNTGVTSNVAGTGISVSGATGAVTISNTGVLSITGTANQITASAATGAITLSTPATFIAPGSIASTTTITAATGLTLTFATANAFLYSGTAGAVTSTAQATNGQLLIGSTGAAPVAATLTAGTNTYITNAAGSITIAGPKYWAESSTAPSTVPSATGNQSMAIGNSAVSSRYGQLSQASGSFGTAGDAQASTYVLRNSTANATPAVLFMDGSAARLTLANNTAIMFYIDIVARRTDATGTYGAWQIRGLMIQDGTAASTTLVGSQSRTFLAGTGLVASSVSVTADITNGALQVNVTGNAAQTIRWVATARITEVANV